MKRSLILLAMSFILVNASPAQGTLSEALKSIRKSGSYDTLFYYGVDLSHVQVNDIKKIPRSLNYSKVYPPAWVSWVEKELPPDGIVKQSLGFKNFVYLQGDIFESAIRVNPRLIIDHDNTIPADTLKAMVSGYSLKNMNGLGLVLIPENFSKPREMATTWVVFFDVRSRNIIYKARINGKCEHMGYTAHWGAGIVNGFTDFVNR